MDILDGLNKQQAAAVTADSHHTLVIAGAGSGKTRVLVSRAAWLIRQQGVNPYQLLAVTFTNKAAREMKDRLEAALGFDTRWLWIGTFHSLCARLLRREGDTFGLGRDFVIYDDGDSRSLIKRCLAELGLTEDEEKNYHPAAVLNEISNAKNDLLTPGDYLARAEDEWQRNVAEIYRRYQAMLHAAQALDFDDLLTRTLWSLQQHPDVLERYRGQFRHILVDEYQDTNRCQYLLIKLLAGETGQIFAVGDPDQSIYRWRGADIANILDFTKDYPDAVEYPLTQNYRSTQRILDIANALIANNQARKPKDLFTEAELGEQVVFYQSASDREEANYVLRHVAVLRDEDGYSLNDIAILYRTHGQSRLFEDACIKAGTQPDFFVYPGEPHNMRGRKSVHLHERITQYFDDYLK